MLGTFTSAAGILDEIGQGEQAVLNLRVLNVPLEDAGHFHSSLEESGPGSAGDAGHFHFSGRHS